MRVSALPVLIYDGDCGFCTRSVRWATRLPVRMRVLPWQQANLTAYRTTTARAQHEVLWVSVTGRVTGGAEAVAEMLKSGTQPCPIFGWIISAPVARSFAEWGYRWVANNRYRLPGSTPACQLPRAQRPGADDSGAG